VTYDITAIRAQFPALKAGSAHFDSERPRTCGASCPPTLYRTKHPLFFCSLAMNALSAGSVLPDSRVFPSAILCQLGTRTRILVSVTSGRAASFKSFPRYTGTWGLA
jgi:hypothetical protein